MTSKKMKLYGLIIAEKITGFIGSWLFIIIQSTILILWVIFNYARIATFDPYPFILLNLFMSFEAAYATPMILMAANRESKTSMDTLVQDLQYDKESYLMLKDIITRLQSLEDQIKNKNHEN